MLVVSDTSTLSNLAIIGRLDLLPLQFGAVLMDEKEGRQCAATLGIRTIGVLGVLIVAKDAGLIPSLKDEITKLRQDAGFFIAMALEARVLAAVGE